MTSKTDGGAAFPLPVNDARCRARFESGYGGMSMRDAFALAALQGLLANPGGPIQANGMNGWSWCNCTAEDVASLTYSMADAMLKARENKA